MPGPFQIRHGQQHCTIQVSPDVIVITGGASNTYNYVTEYQLTGDGMERQLEGLNQGRRIHACGVYQAAGFQVRIHSLSVVRTHKVLSLCCLLEVYNQSMGETKL